MDERILEFIKNEQLLSWAMSDEKGVYIANAFYVFDEKNLAFIIASHEDTKHIKLASKNPSIALNIAKESKIALLKGILAKAKFKSASKEQIKIYFSKFLFLFNLYFVAVNSFKKSSNVSISSLVPIVILK